VITVRLTNEAFATICTEAVVSADGRETGGILLGFDADEQGEALALEAGGPGPNAERRADFFQRDLEHAQQLADAAYDRRCARWIGEWHTHPRGFLTPSRRDLRTYRSFLRDPELHFANFLALIVSARDAEWKELIVTGWTIEQRGILPALLLPAAIPIDVRVDLPTPKAEAEPPPELEVEP
jgi:integrative and conjugative element protein (TIGR02256 family)